MDFDLFTRLFIVFTLMVSVAFLVGKFGPAFFERLLMKKNKKGLREMIFEKEAEFRFSGRKQVGKRSKGKSNSGSMNPYIRAAEKAPGEEISKEYLKVGEYLQQIMKGKRESLELISKLIEREVGDKFPAGEIRRATKELMEIEAFITNKETFTLMKGAQAQLLIKSFAFLRLLVSDASFGDSSISKVIEKRRRKSAQEVYTAVEFYIMGHSGAVKKNLLIQIAQNPNQKCGKLKLLPELKLARTILKIIRPLNAQVKSIDAILKEIYLVMKEIEEFKVEYFKEQERKSQKKHEQSKKQKQQKARPKVVSEKAKSLNTLGCQDSDSWTMVRKNYRKLIMKHHPDKVQANGASDTEIKRANEEFQKIQEAYEYLEKKKAS